MMTGDYPIGRIACEAAFTADFEVPASIPIPTLIERIDGDRSQMMVRPGLHHKYVPLRFDPATGAHQIGGRYLFARRAHMLDYVRFTSEELEFEPGVKFWDRPFFSHIQRQVWQVVAAENFLALPLHYFTRMERLRHGPELSREAVETSWAHLRDEAAARGLAAVWLLYRPDAQEIAIVSAAARPERAWDSQVTSDALERFERSSPLSRLLPANWNLSTAFDRTSVILSVWLPLSQQSGGVPALFPTYPLNQMPGADGSTLGGVT